MKIIGRTGEDRHSHYLLEATASEVANLIGHYSDYDREHPVLRVGDSIDVSAMYRRLYKLSEEKESLLTAAKNLRAFADLLEAQDPVIRATDNEPQEGGDS